jgi:hypothetical protein
MEELCFLCGPCPDVISKGHGQLIDNSVQESVKRGLEPRGKGIAIVRAITRKRLVTD